MLDVLYPAANDDNIHYNYDNQQTKGIGRLANVTDASGKQSYSYNAAGQITEQFYNIGNTAYVLSYNYDLNGQLSSVKYPSGRVVNYNYDAKGHVTNVTSSKNGNEQTLVNHIAYLPFGPVSGFSYGNGAIVELEHDQNYRLRDARVKTLAANDAVYDRHYDYDATSNIIAIADRKTNARSQSFVYDSLYRLTGATGSYGQTNYRYDAVGNRTAREQNGKLEAYNYADNSNRLLSVVSEAEQGQLQTRDLSYDAVGNIIRDSVGTESKQLSYGENNRLQQVDIANQKVAGYEHNAKGQRVIKRVNGKVIHFHYNTADQLIAETDASGQPIREYIYGAGQRVAMVDYTSNKNGEINFMVNDHLGTPQLLLNAKQQVVWSVDQSPFGEVKTEGSIEQPLRFPGQYADSETGYSYNYFRDYDPSLGRYIESDPIGLEGGVNTFGYVGGRPIELDDLYGLDPAIHYYYGVPPDAVRYTSQSGVSFYMPSRVDFNIQHQMGYLTGQQISPIKQLSINFDEGHFGTYDYQRQQIDNDNFLFIGAYTDASNYGAGVYMHGAGYTYEQAHEISSAFAKLFSTNAGSSVQESMWKAGWNDAAGGLLGTGSSASCPNK